MKSTPLLYVDFSDFFDFKSENEINPKSRCARHCVRSHKLYGGKRLLLENEMSIFLVTTGTLNRSNRLVGRLTWLIHFAVCGRLRVDKENLHAMRCDRIRCAPIFSRAWIN
jgi:hypothetical protein